MILRWLVKIAAGVAIAGFLVVELGSPLWTRASLDGTAHDAANDEVLVDGVKCGPDGVRCDVNGNVWASSNAGRAVGYSGVTVWTPEGKLIGRIRLPEICGNVCFGGPKRNRLFMAASQSLYAVYTATQGAGPG